jgi:hypothetical protein
MPTGITTTVGRVPIPFAGFGSYGATLLDLPGDMRDRAAIVDQQIRALMIDVDANWQSIPNDVREAWYSFVTEWTHFTGQDEGAGEGWLYGEGVGNWWSAGSVSMDAINQRAQEIIDWRRKISGFIGALSSPEPTPPPPPTDPLGLSKIGAMLPWIIGGIVAIYVLPVLFKKE